MTINLDHFFILTDLGAPQADLLSEIGLIEGTTNEHPGQGTANRRFFFSDTALELLYIRDANEVRKGPASRLCIAERAADAKASPFGLIVKTTAMSTGAPFPAWHYGPQYYEAGKRFLIGENSDLLEEPLCVCAPFDAPLPAGQPAPADEFSNVTEIRVGVPVTQPSPVLETMAQCERISIRFNKAHLMEIVFNKEDRGHSRDLRPHLPLVIHW